MTPRTLQWAHDIGLVGDHDNVLERMGRSFNPESYAGWLYPSTRDVRALRILCDFVLWATALDDELERAGPACSDDGRQELLLSCAALLRGTAPGSPALQKYVAGFRDLSARLDEVVDPSYLPSWRARLLARMADNHASVVSQEHRAYRDWQDFEFYAAVRPDSSGLIPYLTFIEVMEGCPLSPAAADDPRLSRLHQVTALIFGLFNDVMSLDKERTGGPAFNAVLIVE
jgi:hypothetical protein